MFAEQLGEIQTMRPMIHGSWVPINLLSCMYIFAASRRLDQFLLVRAHQIGYPVTLGYEGEQESTWLD